MKTKSLSLNAALNCAKTLVAILFPLITMPYINRVLQVERIGAINFANTYVNYYIQLAGLGIANYAIREGARKRDDRDQLSLFCSQMFTINMISMVVSYCIMFITLLIFPSLRTYYMLIVILSINIVGTTLGISWLYSILEDYVYITIRSLVFQIVALVLMFTIVKTESDVWKYAVILVVSSSGAGIFNFIHSRKYISLRLVKNVELKKHLGPIMVLFASSIAMIVYVNSDSTMIGLMSGDYYNGLYSVSVKIYTILKNILVSVFIVTLPRLSYYLSNEAIDKYKELLKRSLSLVVIIIFPVIVGINMLCKEVIIIVGGESYLGATPSLHILSFSIFFSLIATYFTTSILLPKKKEKTVFVATAISAAINILLNLFMIPLFQERGAAITTLIAEIVVVIIEYPKVKDDLSINGRSILNSLLGCIWIIVSCILVKSIVSLFLMQVTLSIVISAGGYFCILVLLKTVEVSEFLQSIKNKIGKR